MEILKKFKPDYFNGLSIEEKKECAKKLAYYIMDTLKLERIPVTFNMFEDEPVAYLGKLLRVPTFIFIHEILLTGNSSYYNGNADSLNNDVLRTYLLVHTIAHECYHYYQFDLTKKLVNNPESLTKKEKENAYNFFISSFSKIFSKINEKDHFSNPTYISENDLYLFSYSEYRANKFANRYTTLLGINCDTRNNLELFHKKIINLEEAARKITEKTCGEKMYAKVTEHNLNLTLDYLNYKKKYNNLKGNYLGIDTNELKKYAEKLIETQKDDRTDTEKLLDVLFKKK